MKIRHTAVALTIACTVAGSARAATCPTAPTGSLVDAVEAWLDNNNNGNLIGICVAVQDGDTYSKHCAGKTGMPAPNDMAATSTLFPIGSITKVFTGTLFAQQVYSGVIGLDDLMDDHRPAGTSPRGAATLGGEHFSSNPITLYELATHHSGLPSDGGLPSQPSVASDNLAGWYSAFANQIYPHGSVFTIPGEYYAYSDFGVGLLGELLTQNPANGGASGLSYFEMLQLNVTLPIGLTHTMPAWDYTEYGKAAYYDAHAAHRYCLGGSSACTGEADYWYDLGQAGWISTYGSAVVESPAGSLYSDANDMLTFLNYAMGRSLPNVPSGSALAEALTLLRTPFENRDSAGGSDDPNARVGITWSFDLDDPCEPNPTSGHANYTRVSKVGDVPGGHAYIGYLQDPSDPYGRSPRGVVVMVNSDVYNPADIYNNTPISDLGESLLRSIPKND